MTAFLRVALVNCLFVVALVAGRIVYDGQIHPAGKAALCAVLAVYCYGAGWALLAPAPALALHDDPGGGGPICYWTWDHRFVCGP